MNVRFIFCGEGKKRACCGDGTFAVDCLLCVGDSIRKLRKPIQIQIPLKNCNGQITTKIFRVHPKFIYTLRSSFAYTSS
jgi:hypothetical protein